MKVLLGVTAGIAAYKAPDLVRKLVKAGCDVRVVLTDKAAHFVAPLALETVSGHPVAMEMFGPRRESAVEHIELGLWPDVVLVAPATADFLGKMAGGLADDLLSTVLLALRPTLPVVLAPAMNTRMWNHPAVRRNLDTLRADLGDRLHLVGPVSGPLACGEEGQGAMAAPEEIVATVTVLPVPQSR
jgi:phosphopantothenoylcysteine decarboxylase/phosphopantothenate--cysteine ligase